MALKVLAVAAAMSVAGLSLHQAQARELSVEELEKRKERDEERRRLREERRRLKGRVGQDEKAAESIAIGLLRLGRDIPKALSNLDPILQNEAVYGARLGVEDNATTGRFTGHAYTLEEIFVPVGGDVMKGLKGLLDKGARYIVADLAAESLVAVADAALKRGALVFNIRARDDSLRNEECRANLLHVIPSRAMYADALVQFLMRKGWRRWMLIIGPDEGDRLVAAALRRAARKFGGEIVGEKVWDFTHDIRRTAKSEVPVFTKEAPAHDVLLVADEKGEFGEYLVWHTWRPRLVAGTQGLVATAWHRTHEQWGAAQMQNRFRRAAGRWMTSVDYAAWVAVRSVGEAVTRQGTDFDTVRDYLLGADFGIAAYKGVKVSYRRWNGQLRQRILLASPRSLVSVSPQRGYLHPVTPNDTLGFDAPLSSCRLAGGG